MRRQFERIKLAVITMVSLPLLHTPAVSQTQQPARGRIEGVVVQAGTTPPQPVVGARITVTKANAATGANFLVPGKMSGTWLNAGGLTPFPGTPAWGQALAPPGMPVGPPPETALPIPPVITDRSGRFVVPDLDEGSYRLLVTQNGYVRQEYGQRVFPGQGTFIRLGAGQAVKEITIRLIETGNVAGRIVDNTGLPAVGVPLQLLKASYNQTGQRVFQQSGTTRTNDRGEYRFHWVTPGRYYLAGGTAAATYSFLVGGNSPNEPGESYLLTYYPGVMDISRATAIDINSGSEAVLDFVVPKQQLFRISGKVVNPAPSAANGTPPAVTISLAFQSLTGSMGAFFPMQQDYDPVTGIFVLRDVLPGSYVLQAAVTGLSARLPVEVTNSNVDNLVVTINTGVNITGRFIIDGGNLPPSNTLQVQMRLTSNGLQNYVVGTTSQTAAADGSFSIANVVPGEYRIIANPSQDFYVKELRYNRLDALSSPVSVCCDADSATIEVLISRNVSQIDGVIVDDRMQPVPGVQAVLIPDARHRTELFKTATTDQMGRFVMRGLTPGDYKLFAWEALENYGYFDPDVMQRAESLGKPVHVGESSRLTVEGKIIPAGN